MATLKTLYGANNQAIACTFTSLVSGGQRGSAAIDNTGNQFLDALVEVIVKTGGANTSVSGFINVWAYGTSNGGTNYSDGVTGTDAGQTLTSPTNLRLIGIINCVANSTQYVGGPFSVAAAFGGILPDHWGIVIENKTGGTLDATIGSAVYQGVQMQSI